MGTVKKLMMWALILSVLLAGGLWTYLFALTASDFNTLLFCSEGKDNPVIPAGLCRFYLFNFSGSDEDIAQLEQGPGIGWVLSIEDAGYQKRLLRFFLKKGASIDTQEPRSGITALHEAVLANNADHVALLLEHGASPQVRGRNSGRTPLQFALDLQNRPGQPDRTRVIRLLERSRLRQQRSDNSSQSRVFPN